MQNLELTNITKFFDEQQVLHEFNYQFHPGRIAAVVGESGCGKTSLLRIIAGLDHQFDGVISGNSDSISYVFQEDRLLEWMDVYENITFPIKESLSELEVQQAVDTMIRHVGLAEHVHKTPSQLSGGMQRRVALCRGVLFPSEILLMDEPFKGLNEEMKLNLAKQFLSMAKRQERIVIISTHDPIVIQLADEVVQLDDM